VDATMRIDFTTRAVEQLLETAAYYDGLADGLGEEFRLAVEAVIERISMFPDGSPPVEIGRPGTRRARVRRFPYGVFYLHESGAIQVLGVLHSRRELKSLEGPDPAES
jgi:plasmid stabilization system protein ParE